MTIKTYARENPFADPDEWKSEDFELLRDRAKIHMAHREWERALFNINRTLYNWGAQVPEAYDHSEPPNKQVGKLKRNHTRTIERFSLTVAIYEFYPQTRDLKYVTVCLKILFK